MSTIVQLEDLLISAEVNWVIHPDGKASTGPAIIVRVTDLDGTPITGLSKRNFSLREMTGFTQVPLQVVELNRSIGFLAGTYTITLDVTGIFAQKGQLVYVLKVSSSRSIGQVIISVVRLT